MPDAPSPATPPASDSSARQQKFARQKRLVAALGIVLIVVGIVVSVALRRLPTPLRLAAGLGDVFMGCFLLVLVWQVRRK